VSENKIMPKHRTTVEEILGDEQVTGVRARDLASGALSEVPLSGLFVYIGLKPNTSLLQNVLKLSETGHVSTDGWMRTAREGLYAAGDIRQDSAAQAITSAGDGATAAIAAYRYIRDELHGR
jgi:thioredoxin reductase (NADPH)